MKGKGRRLPVKARIPDERQIRYGRVMGLIFCVGGFVAIGLGWSGAARKDCVDCQLPFLLSGGAVGLGLIMFGGVLLLMAQLRSDSRRVGARLEEVAAALVKSAERELAHPGEGEVVAGTSTYHRPDCRLIHGKTGLELVSLRQATERGLSPCRVCDPPVSTEASPRAEGGLLADSKAGPDGTGTLDSGEAVTGVGGEGSERPEEPSPAAEP